MEGDAFSVVSNVFVLSKQRLSSIKIRRYPVEMQNKKHCGVLTVSHVQNKKHCGVLTVSHVQNKKHCGVLTFTRAEQETLWCADFHTCRTRSIVVR
jgi:hypothetical protein